MKDAKRAINSAKHDRVRAVIAQIKDQGREDDLKATMIARRAGVHRSFVSNHFAAEIPHARAEIQSRFIAGLNGQTALSAASLGSRWKPPSSKRAKRTRRSARSSSGSRKCSAMKSPTPIRSTAAPLCDRRELQAEVEQLLAAQVELSRQLRDTEEELEAARRLNRTLIRERNIGVSEASA